MKITVFSEELRKCLNAAGLSDCGENDTWNYWYQRLMNAYNESVERQIMTEQAENAKLREELADAPKCETCEAMFDCDECLRADGSHKERRRLSAENAKLREQVDAAHMSRLLTENENEKLRELLQRLLVEYRYLRVRPRKMYLQHEARMRAIEEEMHELGIEVDE